MAPNGLNPTQKNSDDWPKASVPKVICQPAPTPSILFTRGKYQMDASPRTFASYAPIAQKNPIQNAFDTPLVAIALIILGTPAPKQRT
jgi:hypothetical protein